MEKVEKFWKITNEDLAFSCQKALPLATFYIMIFRYTNFHCVESVRIQSFILSTFRLYLDHMISLIPPSTENNLIY